MRLITGCIFWFTGRWVYNRGGGTKKAAVYCRIFQLGRGLCFKEELPLLGGEV